MMFYKAVLSSFFGGACRFQPSCSEYAIIALNTHSPIKALYLIFHRLIKCRPGGSYGFDPVPSSEKGIKEK